MPNQVIKPATDVIFTNQLKTFPEPDDTLMYARNEKAVQKMMESNGRPALVVLVKILGPFPESARPYRARDEVYKSDEAADHADVRNAALITCGRPLMPAV